ncbi:MAG: cysteine desulfurase [Puniceicoccales bacterium]|nr:cysteine desulfurase [Puniceicoccales bacterium]
MGYEFSIEKFRKQFPILSKPLKSGNSLIYLDNLATTQKPQSIIDKIVDFYSTYNSNVHRGMYEFSERATNEYEQVRHSIAEYFGVNNPNEIIFVRGATEAINLVAYSYGRKFLTVGDEILIGAAEHHANYLPWQVLEQEIGVRRRIIPLNADYTIDMEKYEHLFSKRTKFVAIQHISNVLGSINDIRALGAIAHAHGAKILVDGACSLAAEKINLGEIDCDFFACSGHKGFGPTGSGFLFGKYDLLQAMLPYYVGGNMVNKVHFEESSFKLPPTKFEAGTPDIAAILGLGATIDFLKEIDWKFAKAYFFELVQYAGEKIRSIPGIKIYGTSKNQSGVFSFNLKDVHAHDVATHLGSRGIAIRAGTHCTQPLMQVLGVSGTARISLCLYNTKQEIDKAIIALGDCLNIFTGKR